MNPGLKYFNRYVVSLRNFFSQLLSKWTFLKLTLCQMRQKILECMKTTLLTHHLFGRHAMQMRNVQLTAVKASIVILELSFTHHIPIYLISWNSLWMNSQVVLKIKASSKEAPLRRREREQSGLLRDIVKKSPEERLGRFEYVRAMSYRLQPLVQLKTDSVLLKQKYAFNLC